MGMGRKGLQLSMVMMISVLTLFHGAGAGAPKLDPAIQKICDATPNPKVCGRSISYAGMGDQMTPDVSAVLELQVNAGMNATRRAIYKAKEALHEDTYISKDGSSYYADSIQVCLDSYDSATDSWNSALVSLKAKRGFDVANDLTSVSSMVMSCEDALTGGDPTVVNDSPLARIDRLILKMTSNALKLREMVFPSIS
ncbi:Pectinesterase inhibitor domain protein [Actinidia chinensis var. chinensis]|uniref:Pectinesterase inhibitor domain protein n=1 Tax=Actinidia chinensis var. chinensis TaxID=1590841 RepID=A0A2R6PNS8_ACTCC|nr:Pectinesterase inhibitor domain protein [Actinidia chinensis var. chinensis]